MSIRIRVYPQPNSIGARRNRVMKLRAQALHLQQLRVRQQTALLQQQLQGLRQGGFGGYGMQPGFAQAGYAPTGYAQPGFAQYGGLGGYGTQPSFPTQYGASPFGGFGNASYGTSVGQCPPPYAPAGSAWSGASFLSPVATSGYGYAASPFAGLTSAFAGMMGYGRY